MTRCIILLVNHRQGTKGDLVRKATIMDVYVWKPERGAEIESAQLVISTEADGPEVKYSLCHKATQQALFR